MTQSIPVESKNEPQNRSMGALAVFLIFVLPMPFCLLVYHFILWSTEQSAIASLSLKNLESAGLIGLAVQAVLVTVFLVGLQKFTTEDRFKPIYAGLIAASAMAFPGLLLKFIGPNNDQFGSMVQALICIVGADVVMRTQKRKLDWDRGSMPFGLVIAAIGFAPFAIYGAFGSFGDAFLSLLASLAFGVLAATLMESSTGNFFLDGIGIGAVLALLGSAIGYDGSQLLLIAILPAFAFAVSAVMPSKAAAGAATSMLAFASLALFDPTELTILLSDMAMIALRASAIVIGIGLLTGVIALILRFVINPTSGQQVKRAVGWAGAGVSWMVVTALFFTFGNPGRYGDRLFVILKDQADISDVAQIKDREERLTAAYTRLTAHSNTSQAEIRKVFDAVGVEYTPYYLENAMEVQGGTLVRLFLLTRPEVDRVLPSPRLRAVPADEPQPGELTEVDGSVQWNISMIGADRVWEEFNVRGEGIVIGNSDSGVDGNHPAVAKQYRGYNGSNDYNWFDPWDGTSFPNDEGGHGTHTTGTILGSNGIGVAPDAKWIGCVNLDRNLANPALYLDCMQFMLAPFPQGGNPLTDGDPTQAAHVLNNSWGCPSLEGCDANSLMQAADNLRYAGIFVVVSAGNDGPICSTVESPLSLYDSVFSVGAIDENGNMADFSSRGPVVVDESGRIKPDIVAPGVDVMSSLPNGTYGINSGTSMAGPHLVGVVALIWSAKPSLIGDIEATEKLIQETADQYEGAIPDPCGSGGEASNVYGYGVVNVYEAVERILRIP